jgi:hypothetical protein
MADKALEIELGDDQQSILERQLSLGTMRTRTKS